MATTILTCKTVPGAAKMTSAAGDTNESADDISNTATIIYRLLFSGPVLSGAEADAIAGGRVPAMGAQFPGGPSGMIVRNRNWQSNPDNRAMWTCELTYSTPNKTALNGNMIIHGAALPSRVLTAELEDIEPEEALIGGAWEWKHGTTAISTAMTATVPAGAQEGDKIRCKYTHPDYGGTIKAEVTVGDVTKLTGKISFSPKSWENTATADLSEVEPSAAQSGGTFSWVLTRSDGSTADLSTSGTCALNVAARRENVQHILTLTYSHNDYSGQLKSQAVISDMMVGGGGGNAKQKNPQVGIAYDVAVDTNAYQRVAQTAVKKTYNGTAWTTSGNSSIVNSAGDKFASPVMETYYTTTVSWWQIEPQNFDPTDATNYMGVINDRAETVAGFSVATETGIIRKISPSQFTLDDGSVRWKTQYAIEINPAGWYVEVLNMGFRALIHDGFADITQKDAIECSGMSAADKKDRIAKLKGGELIQTPWPLNQDGTMKSAGQGGQISADKIGFLVQNVNRWPSGMATSANHG